MLFDILHEIIPEKGIVKIIIDLKNHMEEVLCSVCNTNDKTRTNSIEGKEFIIRYPCKCNNKMCESCIRKENGCNGCYDIICNKCKKQCIYCKYHYCNGCYFNYNIEKKGDLCCNDLKKVINKICLYCRYEYHTNCDINDDNFRFSSIILHKL